MIYVYDVLVNLNEEMLDFYDWDDTDEFSHVRRVPMFKVVSESYYDLVTKDIKIDEEALNSIKDKTQIFSSRNIEVIPYACVFSDGNSAVMITFDNKGNTKKKSKFLINEEMEILEITKSMGISNIKCEILSKVKRNNLIRSEKRILNSILKELETLKDDSEKIDYLYYEWFEKEEGERKYYKLVSDLKKGFTSKHKEFLELLHLLTRTKVNYK